MARRSESVPQAGRLLADGSLAGLGRAALRVTLGEVHATERAYSYRSRYGFSPGQYVRAQAPRNVIGPGPHPGGCLDRPSFLWFRAPDPRDSTRPVSVSRR